MMMALAATRDLPVRAGARRRHPARRRGRGRRQGAVRRRPLRPRPDDARRRRRSALPRLRLSRRRLPVPGHRGHLAGGRRSARHVAAALRAGAFRPPHLDRHGAPLRPRRARARNRAASRMRDILSDASVRNAMVAARGLRRLHQPDPAPARHRLRRRTARAPRWTTGRASTARCRAWSMPCPTAPRAIPPCRSSSPAACPKCMLHLRRAGLLDTGVLTVSGQTLGDMLDWWEQSERRARAAHASSASATASIPTTSSWTPTARAAAASPPP